MELLWLSEGGEISLDSGSIGFVGFVSLLVGVVCCCETPDRWWLWIGLDSRVVIGCWRVL